MSNKTISNPTGDRQDKIANAAKVLGKSVNRLKVFNSIYTGKKNIKTVEEIIKMTGIKNSVLVLQQTKKLVDENMIHKHSKKINGKSAFEKDGFYQTNRNKIIALTKNKKKLDEFPTKTNPKLSIVKTERIIVSKTFVKIKRIYIDDIDNFSEVKRIISGTTKANIIRESAIKEGIIDILKETYEDNDWGGETDDLFTTKLKINKKRLTTAFALKGRATQGKLTPKKMGKNGDQIQRLFRSSSDLFILVYHSNIDQSIFELMESLSKAKSLTECKQILYCIIDGSDIKRLIDAYQESFKID